MQTSTDLALLTKAYEFAAYKHRDQRRKSGDIPYINHPIQVASIISQSGITDINILCAAVLHDTIEDTDTTEAELENEFGAKVLKLVLECSDDKSLGKVDRKRNQIEHALHVSKQAKPVKIADKISNNRDMSKNAPATWSKERIFGYHVWSEAVSANLQGDYPILDQQMREVFKNAGVYDKTKEERLVLLEAYYVELAK